VKIWVKPRKFYRFSGGGRKERCLLRHAIELSKGSNVPFTGAMKRAKISALGRTFSR
jgi:hypothetical protein